MALSTSPQTQTDTWIKATWEAFFDAMNEPQYENARGYFDNGHMRIEITTLA